MAPLTLLYADCLDILPQLPGHSVNLVLCDLPYGKTAATWDAILPMERLWAQYARLLAPRGAVALTAVQPFTSMLVASNPKWYRHTWIWNKGRGIGFQIAKVRPMQQHEDIVIFGPTAVNYYPQMTPREKPVHGKIYGKSAISPIKYSDGVRRTYTERYPTSILVFPTAPNGTRLHPTQKPVALFEYLIRTYTQPDDLVLDHCAGSGTTLIAASNTGRRCIGIERDTAYYESARRRCEEAGIALCLE